MPFTLGIVATVLGYSWIVASRVDRTFAVVPVLIVLGLTAWHNARTREWGFSRRAFWPGLGVAAAVTIGACAVLIALGAALGTLHARAGVPGAFALLLLWGGAQQWSLQTVVLREAQRVSSHRAGAVIAALTFALLHLPNPFLTVLVLLGALGWCRLYDKHPNIIPLALSHAVGTLVVLHAFDDGVTGRLRIGRAFLSLE